MRKFLMPAEWEDHYGTWLSYPHNPDTFFEKIEAVRDRYTDMIRWIAKGEVVHVNVNDESDEEDLRRRLEEKGIKENVTIHRFPTNDAWCRDHGAIFVRDIETGRLVATDWEFNAWGGKYPYQLDNEIPKLMVDYLGVERVEVGMVLEGGSIDTNGNGLFLTTESCLLNKNRNPQLSKEDIERNLRVYLGAQKVIWLKDGIVGDDTDGHVDDITRFVSEDTIITVIEEDKNDENYEPLMENYQILKKTGLNIIPLPMPDPVYYRGDRLPASYANFYISNYAVIVPTFRCDKDKVALETLQRIFRDRVVVGIDATDIVVGLGTFHCLTQQIPKF
ncbi:MAG: agmatine deiminase family protein [Hydrogenothermaceae bacterium]|nr:agmatine deiminase family protein [Hydrogenothermaceae bacterium]